MTDLLVSYIQEDAIKLEQEQDLDTIVEAVGDAQIVLLGEATHGTSEFYSMRAALSKRLIEQKQFKIVAVEGDWPSCYAINRYVKGYDKESSPFRALESFERWPNWMWANVEIAELIQWMRQANQARHADEALGFYGLDVYSLWESLDEILNYVKSTDSKQLEQAKRAMACFEAYRRDGQTYGVSASFFSEDGCESEVVELLQSLRKRKYQGLNDPQEQGLNAEMNALVAVNAEKYYRAMVRGGPESWNIRDLHMVDTLNRLLDYHGKDSKVIIWEHNTHIGDARATDMALEGMLNVGQLVREQWGPQKVFAVGFGTYQGTVLAGKEWGAVPERMDIPPAQPGSWEAVMHQAYAGNQWIFFRGKERRYAESIGHRAIGVVYHPEYERLGNYVPSVMSARYDGFVHIDTTHALKPLLEPVMA